MNTAVLRRCTSENFSQAVELAKRVFNEFEAPMYSAEGVKTFTEFLGSPQMKESFDNGTARFWGAFDGDRIVSLFAMRNLNHICLVFTDKAYQRQGLAKALFHAVKNETVALYPNIYRITLNSSPYGVPFYHSVGFTDLSPQREDDGIIYTPMEYVINDTAALKSLRLVLRPYEERDVNAVDSYASVPENVRYMLWGPNTFEQSEGYVNDCISHYRANDGVHEFIVDLKENGKAIGGCGISVNNGTGNLGWILHRDYHKLGYGTELAKSLIRYGFETLNLHRITAQCHVNNYPSFTVMERAGMRREATYVSAVRGWAYDNSVWADAYEYAILKDEWDVH